ncbi:MAG: SMC-Scp complex subunit ScpB [Candidatus Pacebacteria bacterium]|nr:SMC-Scp complex subunit ScpB [Candidatus Paceibacterota bacterium]
MNLEHSIEALLFWKGEPISLKELIKSLTTPDAKVTEDQIHEALMALSENLKGRGITLLANEDQEYMLGTSAEASVLIEKLTKEELARDLGKASLETLSIILYRGPIKRSEIDYVRGVNSTFILRNLLIRGLIEKKPAPDDNRTSIYTASFKLLSYLGINKLGDLPNFEAVKAELEKFKNEQENEEKNESENQQSEKIGQTDETEKIKDPVNDSTESEDDLTTDTALEIRTDELLEENK